MTAVWIKACSLQSCYTKRDKPGLNYLVTHFLLLIVMYLKYLYFKLFNVKLINYVGPTSNYDS